MPCTFAFDADRGVMILRATGEITTEELFAARDQGAAQPYFSPKLPCLADFRGVTMFHRSIALIRQMAENPVVSRRTKVAIVPPVGEPWAMARFFAACAQLMGRPVEVFSNIGDAERWLGIAQSEESPRAAGTP